MSRLQVITLTLLALCLTANPSRAHGPNALSKKASELKPVLCQDVETLEDCHGHYAAGCAVPKKPGATTIRPYDAFLDYLKNQTPKPTVKPIKTFTGKEFIALESKLPEDLKKGHNAEHADELAAIGQGRIYALIGYLYDVQVQGAETSNCNLPKEADKEQTDYHVLVGFDAATAKKLAEGPHTSGPELHKLKQSSVVVEMTPHYRAWHQPKWSEKLLKPKIGKQVKVVGQLLADTEHYVAKDDCGHPNALDSCWRATIWELHPVIEFYVCTEPSCALDSPNWKKLKDLE